MSLTSKILKGSAALTLSEAVSQGCGLIRNIILARILTKADFGVAATLGMTVTLLEIGGRLSIEHLLVQSDAGDEPRFMATAHLIQVILGVVSGAMILLVAAPVAQMFDVPEAAWAFRAIALVPLLRAFAHLDVWRMMRQMRFFPSASIEIVTQVAITAATWPLTVKWQSYAVLLWLMVARQLFSTVASHIMAERRYRWAFDLGYLRQIASFGWPLMLGGLLVFCVTQGDRLVVGTWYGLSDLGTYAVAGTLVMVPAFTLLKVSGSIMLPLLASVRTDQAEFCRRLGWCACALSLTAVVYSGIIVIAGDSLLVAIFGGKYAGAGALLAWLAVGQSAKILRGITTVAALAKGDSKNMMLANVLRLTGLILGFIAATMGQPMYVVAMAAAAGEATAFAGSIVRLRRRHSIDVKPYIRSVAIACGFISIAGFCSIGGLSQTSVWLVATATSMFCAAALGTYALAHPELFGEVKRLFNPVGLAALREKLGIKGS
jgi:O-antigen/teichoic acid export membrane protein